MEFPNQKMKSIQVKMFLFKYKKISKKIIKIKIRFINKTRNIITIIIKKLYSSKIIRYI